MKRDTYGPRGCYSTVRDEAMETLLHASYSLPAREYVAVRFALDVMLGGLRARLGISVNELRDEREAPV